jgi:hypothetical protein
VGATEVPANLPGGAADEQAVVPAVHGQLVTPRRHLARERQVPGQRGPEQEECRADVVLGEHVQEPRGRQAPRAVVEGQRHVIGIAESGVLRQPYWRLGANAIAAFWLSYIVTCPLGAPSPTGSAARASAAVSRSASRR